MASNQPPTSVTQQSNLSTADHQLFLLAISALQRQDPAKAIPILLQLTQRASNYAPAYSNLAFAYNEIEQFEKAIDAARRAVTIDASSLSAKTNLGLALRGTGDPDGMKETAQLLEDVYRQQPENGEALFNFCLSLFDQGQFDQALQGFTACRQAFGEIPKILENIAACQIKLQNYSEAITTVSSLLGQSGLKDAQRARGFHDLGVIATEQGDAKTALDHFKKALSLRPSFCDALVHQGIAQNTLGQYELALQSFEKAFEINPEFPFLLGRVVHQKMLCADWNSLDQLIAQLNQAVVDGRPAAEPFGYQAIADDPKTLMICAKTFSQRQHPKALVKTEFVRSHNSERIALGFVAGEFRDHATSMLIVGLLEAINRDAFTVTLFDNGWSDNSAIRQRLQTACDIVPIRSLNDTQAIATIKQKHIDVLFNLNGFFGEMRHNLFIERAAPIQVNFLGFPGSLGIENMDFIIADETVIPTAEETFYLERVLRMPHSYQSTDAKRDRPILTKTKIDLGLCQADQGASEPFVFCCFNNSYKITPVVFDAWMRILGQVPNSVLWLLETHALTKKNLQSAAQSHGVNRDRLIFAPRTDSQDHLARHAAADLILDTTPYNAHTTASDALWMGVPLLTIKGTTFPGRVGESLLKAVGFGDELIAKNLDDYFAKAIEIATTPGRSQALKTRLERNRLTTALFNTEQYARDFENLIRRM